MYPISDGLRIPFFFLAPSRQRGRGDQGIRRREYTLAANRIRFTVLCRHPGEGGTARRTRHVPKVEPPCPASSFEDGNRVGKVPELVPGVWRRRAGIKGQIQCLKRGEKCKRGNGKIWCLLDNYFAFA